MEQELKKFLQELKDKNIEYRDILSSEDTSDITHFRLAREYNHNLKIIERLENILNYGI